MKGIAWAIGAAGAVLAATGAVAAVAGCGSVSAVHPDTGKVLRPDARSEALAIARRMLASVHLPGDAQPVRLTRIPLALRPSMPVAVGDVVQLTRTYRLKLSIDGAAGLVADVPAGTQVYVGGGQLTGQTGVLGEYATYWIPVPPAGIGSAMVGLAVIPRDGGSLLQVKAQVVWNPPRSRAEHIDPSAYRAVTVSIQAQQRTKMYSSPAVIARLARIINGLPGLAPQGPMSCGALVTTYQLVFVGKRPGTPVIRVAAVDCGLSVAVSVGGHAQPTLGPISLAQINVIRLVLGLRPVGTR